MNEMVDRVAASLAGYELGSAGNNWTVLAPEMQDKYRNRARVAIEAMREPTWAMTNAVIEASCRTIEERDFSIGPIQRHWAMMIDEALK